MVGSRDKELGVMNRRYLGGAEQCHRALVMTSMAVCCLRGYLAISNHTGVIETDSTEQCLNTVGLHGNTSKVNSSFHNNSSPTSLAFYEY